jgi:hypothetical protein
MVIKSDWAHCKIPQEVADAIDEFLLTPEARRHGVHSRSDFLTRLCVTWFGAVNEKFKLFNPDIIPPVYKLTHPPPIKPSQLSPVDILQNYAETSGKDIESIESAREILNAIKMDVKRILDTPTTTIQEKGKELDTLIFSLQKSSEELERWRKIFKESPGSWKDIQQRLK